ncbi:MAG: single-stranded-DNA-specific exonuclease RecJ, partial [Gammaproteobacteria bacterium]|nr:single-stranded-DNA-specific exonuclease RecJ [Gammaproteobacteria bacterium]
MNIERPITVRPKPDEAIIRALSDLDPVLARLFAMRGVRSADDLDYQLGKLAPVSLLDNVDAAVELLMAKRNERIIVVGDFDVDGATSTALVLRSLREFGFADIEYLVPNRFDYGYGLSPEIVEVAAARSPG